jgi:2-phospho-L-lactate guanylyltransferase
MNLRVIIPVKPFGQAKQRLAPALQPAERARLAERMFRHVLGTASVAFGHANILVVCSSSDVCAIAKSEGAIGIREMGLPDLNAAIAQAATFAGNSGASMHLVLASDLPFLEQSDLIDLAAYGCAIAPDRHERGTNALLWPPHLPFEFGEGSFARHRGTAERAGFKPYICLRRGLAHDIDVPDDLRELYPNLARSSGSTRSA